MLSSTDFRSKLLEITLHGLRRVFVNSMDILLGSRRLCTFEKIPVQKSNQMMGVSGGLTRIAESTDHVYVYKRCYYYDSAQSAEGSVYHLGCRVCHSNDLSFSQSKYDQRQVSNPLSFNHSRISSLLNGYVGHFPAIRKNAQSSYCLEGDKPLFWRCFISSFEHMTLQKFRGKLQDAVDRIG